MRFGDKITWDNANIIWDENSYLWHDVREIIEDVVLDLSTINASSSKRRKLDKLKQADKAKLIRLIMHINDIQVYDESKEISNIHVYVEDVKLIIEEIKKNVQIIH